LKGVDLNAGLIGGILVGSVAVLGAVYYYNETKIAEIQAQLLARLDAKDEQMLQSSSHSCSMAKTPASRALVIFKYFNRTNG
jgi:hypothetical protein